MFSIGAHLFTSRITIHKIAAAADTAVFISLFVVGLLGMFHVNMGFSFPPPAQWALLGAGLMGLALLVSRVNIPPKPHPTEAFVLSLMD